jgi:cytochrome c oxidase subunit II
MRWLAPRRGVIACAVLLISGCGQLQSALNPAGEGAAQIADLFWYMTIGGFIIWLTVVALFVYAMFYSPRPHDDRRSRLIVIGGGAVVPTIVLTILLAYGLAMLPNLQAPAREGSITIDVTGLQYWWRVKYPGLMTSDTNAASTNAASIMETANEIVLPAGQEIEFRLHSDDVIHSFWIPSLGGKVDMMPGRVNRLKLAPNRTGQFRGVCAEYCGEAHALMAFDVQVLEPEQFNDWLTHQSSSAIAPESAIAVRGASSFLSLGCGACHSIRGTEANGRYGPDLTHFASRRTFAAGSFENHSDLLARWIRQTHQMKQGVLMPTFAEISDEDVHAIAAYLEGLR